MQRREAAIKFFIGNKMKPALTFQKYWVFRFLILANVADMVKIKHVITGVPLKPWEGIL